MTLKKRLGRLAGGDAFAIFKGMVTLALGSGGARLIGLAAIPVLTRLYSPEDFGVLAVFTALVTILAPMISLRYVLALPLPRRDGTAINLLFLSMSCILVGSILLTLILALIKEPLFSALSMQALNSYWWLIGIGVLLTASYEMMTLWATRKRNYRIIAVTNLWQSTLDGSLKIILGLLSFSTLGLLVGEAVSKSGGMIKLFRAYVKDINERIKFLTWKRVKVVAYAYRSFPYYRVMAQSLLVLSAQAPILIAAAVYDSGAAGHLGLALMAVSLPVNIIGATTSKAYYAEIASIGTRGPEEIRRIKSATITVAVSLFSVSFLPALLLIFWGEVLFSVVFGPEWGDAGRYAAILAFYLVVQLVLSPINRVFSVLALEHMYLFMNLQRIIIIILLFLIVKFNQLEFELFLVSYVAAISFHRLMILLYIAKTLNKKIGKFQ